MGLVPPQVGRDLRVRVVVGDAATEMTVSGELLLRVASEVDVPPPFLCDGDFEKRMIRRALVPIVKLAVESAGHRAAWVAVSEMLGLDPEKGR
jgi:hypothetical protein